MAMDKNISRRLFQSHTAYRRHPESHCKKENPRLAAAENGVGLPCIVKPCCGGSSVGVTIAHTEEEYQAALSAAGFRYENVVIVEAVHSAAGSFPPGWLTEKAYPVIEIAPVRKDFMTTRINIQAGCDGRDLPGGAVRRS